MGRKSSVLTLPREVRDWLDKALVQDNFSGYELMEAALAERGYQISKSALHRYGQPLQRRLSAIKASTEAARIITEGAGDDQDARSEAVIALIQTEMFEAIVNLQELDDQNTDPIERMGIMSKVAKNIASLTNASIAQKRFKTEVRARAQEVAEKAAKLAQKGGLTAETVAEIRKSILGIAS
jgi:chorismate mutase